MSSIGFLRAKELRGVSDGLAHVRYLRHALALDECRVKFLPEYVNQGVCVIGRQIPQQSRNLLGKLFGRRRRIEGPQPGNQRPLDEGSLEILLDAVDELNSIL